LIEVSRGVIAELQAKNASAEEFRNRISVVDF
jgi:hypothetical protein